MDLGTIEKKLQSRAYTSGADEFVRDVRLVWANAIRLGLGLGLGLG